MSDDVVQEDRDRGVVIVEQLDGAESVALVVEVLDERVDEYELEIDGDSLTLYRYWGQAVPADDRVVRVRHARVLDDGSYQPRGGMYPYPESKVRPVGETAGEDVRERSKEYS